MTASDLVLGGATGSLPVRATAYTDDSMAGLVELYAPRAEDLEAVAVTVDVAPIGGQSARTSARAELGELRTRDDGTVSRPAHVSVPLDALEPGDYLARAVVRDRGETIAELVREVRILPGLHPSEAASAAQPDVAHADATSPPISAFTATDVLGGELARRYLRVLSDAARASALEAAAVQAGRGSWDAVERMLGPEPPTSNHVYFGLRGLARFALGRFDDAAADLARACSNTERALPSFLLGWVHELAGSRREAIGAWRVAAFADPTLVPAHLAIADAYLRVSEPALAMQALKAGLTANPASFELREKLSSLERRPQP